MSSPVTDKFNGSNSLSLIPGLRVVLLPRKANNHDRAHLTSHALALC